MRLRRKREWECLAEQYGLDVVRSLLEFDAESHQERVARLESDVRALEKRLEQVEAEQHGHCDGCGAVTDFPTITWCRSPRCNGGAA